MMEEDRMCLSCVGAPQKNKIGFRHLLIRTGGATSSENRRQTGDARGVSSAVATVDVVAADHRSHEFLRDIVQLVCGFRTTEHAKRARPVRFNLAAQLAGDKIKGFVPACRAMTLRLANQRTGQPARSARSTRRHLKLPHECAAESVDRKNATKGLECGA